MINQVFVSEVAVSNRTDVDQHMSELVRPAEEWFGGAVRLVSLEISLRRDDQGQCYVMVGRFATISDVAPSGRVGRAAKWLGLIR